MTESEIKAYITSEVAAQLQAITSKDIASESDVPTLSDAEWDTNNSITSLPVVYNGSAWRKIGAGFLRTLRNAAAVVSTAWNALKNNGTSVSWIPTVDTSGNAGKTSPADLAAVLGVGTINGENTFVDAHTLKELGLHTYNVNAGGASSNFPPVSADVTENSGQCVLISMFTENNYGFHIFHRRNSSNLFIENCENGVWSSWIKIPGVAI